MVYSKFSHILRSLLKRITKPINASKVEGFSLLYHLIDNQTNQATLISENIHNVSTINLYDQLTTLKKQNSFISLEEHIELKIRKRNLNKIISVSIDDGYSSSLTFGKEIFKELQIPVTYFINTSIIEKGQFWRDKVRYIINKKLENDFLAFACELSDEFNSIIATDFYRESKNHLKVNSKNLDSLLDAFLAEKGMIVENNQYLTKNHLLNEDHFTWGNHTNNHFVMSSLSRDQQYEEMIYVKNFFDLNNIPSSSVFSIPFGNPDSFNEDTLMLAHELGYRGVVLCSGYRQAGINDLPDKCKKIGLGVINRFMPNNSSTVFS